MGETTQYRMEPGWTDDQCGAWNKQDRDGGGKPTLDPNLAYEPPLQKKNSGSRHWKLACLCKSADNIKHYCEYSSVPASRTTLSKRRMRWQRTKGDDGEDVQEDIPGDPQILGGYTHGSESKISKRTNARIIPNGDIRNPLKLAATLPHAAVESFRPTHKRRQIMAVPVVAQAEGICVAKRTSSGLRRRTQMRRPSPPDARVILGARKGLREAIMRESGGRVVSTRGGKGERGERKRRRIKGRREKKRGVAIWQAQWAWKRQTEQPIVENDSDLWDIHINSVIFNFQPRATFLTVVVEDDPNLRPKHADPHHSMSTDFSLRGIFESWAWIHPRYFYSAKPPYSSVQSQTPRLGDSESYDLAPVSYCSFCIPSVRHFDSFLCIEDLSKQVEVPTQRATRFEGLPHPCRYSSSSFSDILVPHESAHAPSWDSSRSLNGREKSLVKGYMSPKCAFRPHPPPFDGTNCTVKGGSN
ncbi:hypothetical protein B0H11DRAFT_1917710 [Mycena galericulata]|nr:hypothetical protein B0H11DRAFT_1917710 [Mycena galericulata]